MMKTRTVVVADDSAFMRNWLKKIIGGHGFTVIAEAKDGLQAVKLYNECLPDLLILDITMPKMDGLSALKLIKLKNPQSKIIICSSMGQKSLIIEAIRAGASDFVVKPYFDNLISIMDNCFSN